MARVLFRGGKVLTMDPLRPEVSALALEGGRILAVGSDAELAALDGSVERVVELQGKVLLPGFHDSHVHLTQLGLELAQVVLEDAATQDEALERVAQRAAGQPVGSWVLGSGFALQRWGLERPSRQALDAVAPDHPVLLRSQDHHAAWVNSKALERAGVDHRTPDPPGGRFVRESDGRPSGYLLERAVLQVARAVPEPGTSELREALERAAGHLAAQGVTTVHHMAYEPVAYWRQLALAASRSGFPIRVWACIGQQDIERAAAMGLASSQGGDQFAIGGAKFFADGALGSRTAWMLEPYAGSSDRGVVIDGPEVLRTRFRLALEAGLVPVTHAIGDAANRAVLDALESVRELWQGLPSLPRVEHAQHVHPEDVSRFGQLGVAASMQPIHLTFDLASIETLLPDRLSRAYPVRSLGAAGATLAFGSDAPVASADVLAGLRAACLRRDARGAELAPAEAISVAEALAAYTRQAAEVIGRADRSGLLREGRHADVVVLSGDPHRTLAGLEVVATIKGGSVTYDPGQLLD